MIFPPIRFPIFSAFSNLSFDVTIALSYWSTTSFLPVVALAAALNEIFDQGRPDCVQLAVLVERSGRCLPIQPDYVGLRLETHLDQRVVVSINNDPDQPDSIAITN